MLVDEGAFPIDAAVEELRRQLDRAAHLVAAVRGAHRIREARRTAVARLDAVTRELRRLDHEFGPARERLARIVVIEMRVQGRSRVEPAPKRVRGGGELQVEHALVLRGVGVALLYHVIAPGEIAVE